MTRRKGGDTAALAARATAPDLLAARPWPLADLLPNPRNARVHSDDQVRQLAAAITEFGWTMPVLVDEDGMILAGHGRVLAAKLLGMDTVPVVVATGWTEAQKRAYVIADNKLAANSSWDATLLAAELQDLAATGVDMAVLGFSTDELQRLADDADQDALARMAAGGAPPDTGEVVTTDAGNGYVTMTLSVIPEDRDALTAAIKAAKLKFKLNHGGAALARLCREFVQ